MKATANLPLVVPTLMTPTAIYKPSGGKTSWVHNTSIRVARDPENTVCVTGQKPLRRLGTRHSATPTTYRPSSPVKGL